MSASCDVHRVQTHALASTSGPAAAVAPQTALKLPATYKRLVAKRTGRSFREVAEVEEVPLPQPGDNEVGCLAELHLIHAAAAAVSAHWLWLLRSAHKSVAWHL
jgi:hypothetical protein